MKLIPLTQGQFAMVDDADYDWLMQWSWFAVNPNGSTSYAYTNSTIGDMAKPPMHRVIMSSLSTIELGIDVDHIDHDGLNNRRSNLRLATRSQNAANSRPRGGVSRYKGVARTKYRNPKWIAQITVNKRHIHIGTFVNEDDAALAYNEAAILHFGEFAFINEVPST